MSQRELAWQNRIVKTIKAAGAYAQKTAHRTKVGVPDLLVKLHGLPAALIEVKHIELHPGQNIVNIEVTKAQALHCRSFTRAGGRAFWLAICTFSNEPGVVLMLASEDMEDLKWSMNRVKAEGQIMARGKWEVQFMMHLTRYVDRSRGATRT